MDPHSRRAMWELLRKFKDDRAIVLTTVSCQELRLFLMFGVIIFSIHWRWTNVSCQWFPMMSPFLYNPR